MRNEIHEWGFLVYRGAHSIGIKLEQGSNLRACYTANLPIVLPVQHYSAVRRLLSKLAVFGTTLVKRISSLNARELPLVGIGPVFGEFEILFPNS